MSTCSNALKSKRGPPTVPTRRGADPAAPGRRRGRSRPSLSAGDIATGHHDDERLGLAGGDQVVHDQTSLALGCPSPFHLPRRHAAGTAPDTASKGILFVIRRSVDEAAENGIGALGIKRGLPQLAVRDVLESIKVLIAGGDFDAAAPAARAVEVQAAGIRNLSAIDNDLVVVEAFVLRARVADPRAVIALGQRILYAADVEHDVCGSRSDTRVRNAPFRVDLRILFARLIERRRLEILHGRLVGRCRRIFSISRSGRRVLGQREGSMSK